MTRRSVVHVVRVNIRSIVYRYKVYLEIGLELGQFVWKGLLWGVN